MGEPLKLTSLRLVRMSGHNYEFRVSNTYIGYGRRNLQCYISGTNNVQVRNGILTITAKIQDAEDKHFTSGRIRQLGIGSTSPIQFSFHILTVVTTTGRGKVQRKY